MEAGNNRVERMDGKERAERAARVVDGSSMLRPMVEQRAERTDWRKVEERLVLRIRPRTRKKAEVEVRSVCRSSSS